MSSKKEQTDDFRPYYPKDGEETKPPLKEITFMPSTIETIDFALYDWLNEDLNIFCTTNGGWKKVPLIWSMPERSFQVKNNKDLRNSDDIFTFPVISIERKTVIKDPQMKGIAWAHIPRINDAKGGTLSIARRIKQEKTSNFADADAKRRFGQKTYPFKNEKVVYETITVPLPTYIVSTYAITITTEYQQQMNEIFTPFMSYTGQINNFFINRDGHRFEGFVDGQFSLDNNIANLEQEERKYKTVVNLKILGYIMGADKNDDQPKITIRESAAEIRFTRERVIFGDKKEY